MKVYIVTRYEPIHEASDNIEVHADKELALTRMRHLKAETTPLHDFIFDIEEHHLIPSPSFEVNR